ncbi:Beta-adaptin-like protein B [Zancudomyces culisetae]|uniref:Beta-adaptin-like protein B n=1 Tax=Zancudomyces culisetae TaxID=1213189 RepID=A0A1R1PMQ8_ZANCU|nr:Beta-adaptin-like protein B [Zancudomyces culisetae]OMH84072.1 Beta-adaptin-like protein B [Zancudomyces culisetae]|eukprot:OMH82239.1 Beta-adaptin-like protein B [Zancudomyces culisetae]
MSNQIHAFFIKFNEPSYVKQEKLELLITLANDDNSRLVLMELADYIHETDISKSAILGIAKLAVNYELISTECVQVLIETIRKKSNKLAEYATIALSLVLHRYPSKYRGYIKYVCGKFSGFTEPEAKAAALWITGSNLNVIQGYGKYFSGFVENFLNEPSNVQLALITALAKAYIIDRDFGEKVAQKVMKMATEQIDNPDVRDRAFFYWRLISISPEKAKKVVFAKYHTKSFESTSFDDKTLDSLVLNVSRLSTVYKVPQTVMFKNIKQFEPGNPSAIVNFRFKKPDFEYSFNYPSDETPKPLESSPYDIYSLAEPDSEHSPELTEYKDIDPYSALADFPATIGKSNSFSLSTKASNDSRISEYTAEPPLSSKSSQSYSQLDDSHPEYLRLNSTARFSSSVSHQPQTSSVQADLDTHLASLSISSSRNMMNQQPVSAGQDVGPLTKIFGTLQSSHSRFTVGGYQPSLRSLASSGNLANRNFATDFCNTDGENANLIGEATANKRATDTVSITEQSKTPMLYSANNLNGASSLSSFEPQPKQKTEQRGGLTNKNNSAMDYNANFGNFGEAYSGGLGGSNLAGANSLGSQYNLNSAAATTKTKFLDSSQTNGLEICGSFERNIDGTIQLNLDFYNCSQNTLTGFAIQINQNSFGIFPLLPLQIPDDALLPGSFASTVVPLYQDSQFVMKMDPINNLQIAIKCSLGIFYFQTVYSMHILLSGDYKIDQTEFLSFWRNPNGHAATGSLVFSGLCVNTLEDARSKLGLNNIFSVAQRTVPSAPGSVGFHVLYSSSKLVFPDTKSVCILSEVKVSLDFVHAFVTCRIYSTDSGYLGLSYSDIASTFCSAVREVLES